MHVYGASAGHGLIFPLGLGEIDGLIHEGLQGQGKEFFVLLEGTIEFPRLATISLPSCAAV